MPISTVSFLHGIYTNELPTPIVPMTNVTEPVVALGTAPLHLATNPASPNTPILCSSLSEFVDQFGWSNDFDKFTLCEVAKCHFTVYNVAPVVFINVLDPVKHATTGTQEIANATNPVTIEGNVINASIKITSGSPATTRTITVTDEDEPISIPVTGDFVLTAGDETLTLTTDYTVSENKITLTAAGKLKVDGSLTFTADDETLVTLDTDDYAAEYDDGDTVITFTTSGLNKIVDDEIFIAYRELDPSAVTSQNVIGGVDLMTGANTGLEVLEDVYPKLGVVPGSVIAPKFSTDSAVAQVMASKCNGINGCFKAIAIADLPTSTVRKYTDVTAVKTGNNFVDQRLIACWPKVTLGGEQYHLSTQLAALMCTVDAERDNIPFKSPSNETLKVDGACLSDGTAIYLGRDLANYVNGQGIFTALNFGGWRSWGVYTSAYPNDTDPINFVSVKRMMNWISNNLILNFFNQIDNPMNRVLVDTVLDSVRIWLNGLAARGAILGGEIAFLEEDNPTSELTQGHMLFRMNVGFAVPAKKIEFTIQFDSSYMSTLFGS